MTDIKDITIQMQELKKIIDSLLYSTHYEEGEQLQITYNINSPDDLQLMDEYKNILYKLENIKYSLDYLKMPILFESKLKLRSDGRYGTIDDRTYYTSGSPIEFLYKDEVYDYENQDYKQVTSWRSSRIEHNGNDYYIVGYSDVELEGLKVRIR